MAISLTQIRSVLFLIEENWQKKVDRRTTLIEIITDSNEEGGYNNGKRDIFRSIQENSSGSVV